MGPRSGVTSDRAAFEELFDRQFDRCASIAQRIVHDREVAHDLASDAFAEAWSRWPRLATGNPDGWVLRVTANRAIDVGRRRPALLRPREPLSMEEATVLRVALVQALHALPRRQREVVTMRYLSDLSEVEVSEALGLSLGTVKTHLRRALRRLRTTFPADDPEAQLRHGS